ncbi:MAG TPA: hypothetical protein VFL64_02990 [Rhizobacter sp.]|nr:hypothetical protein [Rhizobacter sp.]
MLRFLACSVVALATGCAWLPGPQKAAPGSVQPQVQAAQQIKQRTAQLPANAYERPADIPRHQALVSDLDATARLVEQRAASLSARDLALSTYYLAQANAEARGISTKSLQPISTQAVAQLRETVAPVQGMQKRLQSGQPPFGYRSVLVTVKTRPGAPEPPRLRVYVLPSGVLERPENFDVATIRQWLADLTFPDLTSPSRGTVAQGAMRVWIGPDGAYDAMARRIASGAPIAFTPLNIAPDGAPEQELQFNAPGDIVRP